MRDHLEAGIFGINAHITRNFHPRAAQKEVCPDTVALDVVRYIGVATFGVLFPNPVIADLGQIMQARGHGVAFFCGPRQSLPRVDEFGLADFAFADIADQEQIPARIIRPKTFAQGYRKLDPASRIVQS